MEQTSMDDILGTDKPDNEAPAAEAPPAEPTPAAPKETQERVTSRRAEHRRKELSAQGRDPDTGQFVAKESSAEAQAKPEAPKAEAPKPPQQEMTPKERAAFAAAADERRKRQVLEQEVARLRQGAQQQAQPAAQREEPKKFWDDPETFLAADRARVLGEVQHQALTARISTSEMLARHRHQQAGDYDANIEIFKELATTTPGVMQQWLQSADPAEFAYRAGKHHRELREAGGLEQLREKMEKELRVQLETEMKERLEAERASRAAIPPSLSEVRGASPTRHRVEYTGPTPMTEILKR